MTHTILVVDDQQPILDLLREALQQESYQVCCAASAEEALPRMARKAYSWAINASGPIIMVEPAGPTVRTPDSRVQLAK